MSVRPGTVGLGLTREGRGRQDPCTEPPPPVPPPAPVPAGPIALVWAVPEAAKGVLLGGRGAEGSLGSGRTVPGLWPSLGQKHPWVSRLPSLVGWFRAPGRPPACMEWGPPPRCGSRHPRALAFPPPQVSRLALSGLRNWTTAALPSAVFAARHFRPFLPPQGQVELGEPWWIVPSELSVFTGYLSNNRFYPPPPKGKEVRAAHGEPWWGWGGGSPNAAAPARHDPLCLCPAPSQRLDPSPLSGPPACRPRALLGDPDPAS